ncbi:hypothetical protein TELCIR_00428 [Teladorsagia circumcincta]|uniref:CHK kinase-like domain-containing protein n=1 Tax=Teladorsagia circumcincta TaxID=45464 RepID=A0A2G9V4S8_TELCI|nr:hypothetical protein TELCIR_00428 [Teladorsagia circumcincta]
MMRSSGGEKMADKIDQVEAIVQDVIDTDLIDKLSTSLGMGKVLCHGDMWSTNLIWKKGENDVDLAAVVDFQVQSFDERQTALEVPKVLVLHSYSTSYTSCTLGQTQTVHFGIPTVDIVRVMCACMSGKDRREHWEEILKAFHSYLEEELEGCNLPYTLDVLKEAYRQYFPFGAFMVVPMIGPLFQMACKSDDTEYKAKVGEVISEKVECLLEDICEFHRQNQLRKGA